MLALRRCRIFSILVAIVTCLARLRHDVCTVNCTTSNCEQSQNNIFFSANHLEVVIDWFAIRLTPHLARKKW